ncbi:hypothetical protein GCM10009530_64020 [Microbispora corallina]|uniref:Peptidase C51 domain-containing protein n=1 Tax=Microbispora corallina TaxID=83302 RepID=A0ABQ4GCH0_9ACTN|nr:CHAP domain-containing protein [Microbispora corallina]GIH44715.1 hypothetical protein Mco01_77150 [Microbispora corallina]
MSGAAALLAAARADLGLRNRPNKITREYASRHGREYLSAPWCDMSVTYWARHSGNAAAVLPFGDRAYTVTHAEDGHRLGRWFAGTVENIRAHAEPGCPIFFDWGGTNARVNIDHIGLVEHVLADGRVQTIEANTGGGEGAVLRRVRSADVIAGFWVPDFSKEDDMPLNDSDIKKVANAVYDRFTHTVDKDVWAAREGILEPGQKIDPRTAFRQIWAYGKDGYARDREILAQLAAQNAAIGELVKALAAQDSAIDADALVARIREEIAQVTIHLDAGPADPASSA